MESLQKHHHAKINGMNDLARHFGVAQWEVLVADRAGKNRSGRRDTTTGGFRAMVAELSRLNATNTFRDAGCDIYAVPKDDMHLYIQIDDVPLALINNAIAAKYTPCAVIETSRENYQAVIKVERTGDEAVDRAACAVLTRELNSEFGGDKGAYSSWDKGFRIPGFSNRKPDRAGEFVKLVKASSCPGHVDALASARFKEIAASLKPRMAEAGIQGGFVRRGGNHTPEDAVATGAQLYARELGLAQKMVDGGTWKGIDLSAIDYRVAKAMAAGGWSEKDAAVAIEANSPDLSARHENITRHVNRTVNTAFGVEA